MLPIPAGYFPRLKIPEKNEDVVFRTAGLRYHSDMNEVVNELAYIDSVKYGNLKSGTKKSNEIDIPDGRYLELGAYYPLRFHLPDHYGIGHNGLITGLETLRYAQANQLRSFLLPIDQLMANMLGLMSNVNQLYDVSEDRYDSYFSQVLEDTDQSLHLLDLKPARNKRDQLYEWEGKLDELDEKFDTNSTDRLQRVTDDLLSRFSESYPSYTLSKTYSQLCPFLTQDNIQQRILKAKREYIDNYDSISYERNKSCNYFELARILNGESEKDTEQILPGLIKKVASLLDITDFNVRSLCDIPESYGFNFYEKSDSVNDVVDKLAEPQEEEVRVDIDEYPSLLQDNFGY